MEWRSPVRNDGSLERLALEIGARGAQARGECVGNANSQVHGPILPPMREHRQTPHRGVTAHLRSGRESIAEHGETAEGFSLGRLVLKNVPVLGELAILEAHHIGRDP